MEAIIITAIIAFAAGVAGGSFFTWLGSDARLRLQENERSQEHAALPAYERAARAYEQAAGRGGIVYASPEKSEEYYRQAARIRQEAEEDMLAGRTPLTDPVCTDDTMAEIARRLGLQYVKFPRKKH